MKSFEAQILEESLISGERTGIDNPITILRDMNNNQEFDDDEVFFYTKDHLGSIRELVGLDGKLKQRQRYSAYGVTTREKNTDQLDKLIDHAYGFTGRERDGETGLYYYRARYYQPSDYVGRFISEDPIGFRGTETNLFRYASNSPLLMTDAMGLYDLPSNIMNNAATEASNSGLPGAHNGPQDAFRHCLASCTMTEENGSFATFLFGQANEVKGDILNDQPKCERDMDTDNNAFGNYLGSQKGGGSCASKCMSALNNGSLSTSPSSSSGGYGGPSGGSSCSNGCNEKSSY